MDLFPRRLPLPPEAKPYLEELRQTGIGLNECRVIARRMWLLDRLDKIQSPDPAVTELRDIVRELYRKDQW